MRPIPKIIFVKDAVIAEAAKIESLLEKIKEVEKQIKNANIKMIYGHVAKQ